MITNEIEQSLFVQEKHNGVYQNILDTIGRTPLVRLNRVTAGKVQANVYAKVEFFNPGGSIKDRVGLAIIEDAEKRRPTAARRDDRGSHFR
jgi:threonine synthase